MDGDHRISKQLLPVSGALFDVMMDEFFSKRWGRICITLLNQPVIWVSIIKPISTAVQSIVVPVITGLMGAATSRMTTELKVKKIRQYPKKYLELL
jgi:hypothetical protein